MMTQKKPYMVITHSYIELNGLSFKAYHGVFPEEHAVGGIYIVDLRLDGDFSAACASDELGDTIDYAAVCASVKDEMKQESALIEHVAARIARRLLDDFPALQAVTVTLRKQTPPVPGIDIAEAAFTLTTTREG